MSISRPYYTNLLALSLFVLIAGGCNKSEPVNAGFSTSLTDAYTGDTIFFYNSSENATYYQWDFGDGEVSILEDPSHVYNNEGIYEVTLVSIGENSSDSITKEIEVILPFDVTIFEGVGIEGAHLSDSWSSIQSSFNSDTTWYYVYDSAVDIYIHVVIFESRGVGFVIPGSDTLINGQDSLSFIYIFPPYAGGTTNGIGIGSTVDRMVQAYGVPENTVGGQGIKGYWYDSKGIDFYSYDSGFVDEIQVYSPYITKSLSSTNLLIKSMIRNRKLWTDF